MWKISHHHIANILSSTFNIMREALDDENISKDFN